MIAVTDIGKQKVREAEEIGDRIRDDVLASLPADEREVFVDALTRLACDRLSAPVQCSQPVRRRSELQRRRQPPLAPWCVRALFECLRGFEPRQAGGLRSVCSTFRRIGIRTQPRMSSTNAIPMSRT